VESFDEANRVHVGRWLARDNAASHKRATFSGLYGARVVRAGKR